MSAFHLVIEDEFQRLNQTIIEQLHSSIELIETIAHHIIDGGGKRLRPLMTILSAITTGYKEQEQGDKHLLLAAIIEFIHTSTLLHDDVVDESSMRRNRKTANAIWDNSAAVLVGDFLYSRAFQMLTQIGNMPIMREFAHTTNTIAEGEVKQLINAGKIDLNLDDYLDIIRKKTAVLFASAMRSGCLLTHDGNSPTTRSLGEYGMACGIAFQIRDDTLDYIGDEDVIGKNLGDDLAEGKMTLPLIYALQNASPVQQTTLTSIIKNKDISQLSTINEIIHATNALQLTDNVACQYSDQAINFLKSLPDSSYKQTLVDIAVFAVERKH